VCESKGLEYRPDSGDKRFERDEVEFFSWKWLVVWHTKGWNKWANNDQDVIREEQ
jgi:hypothetical protein